MRSRRRLALYVVLTPTIIVFLVLFVYPTRTWLQQRRDLDLAQQRLEVLDRNSQRLARENRRLESDAEVERRAREDYGMTRPGETAYVLVPAEPIP